MLGILPVLREQYLLNMCIFRLINVADVDRFDLLPATAGDMAYADVGAATAAAVLVVGGAVDVATYGASIVSSSSSFWCHRSTVLPYSL